MCYILECSHCRCVVLFDQGFDVSAGIYNTGMRNGLQLVTNCREMILKSWTRRKAKEWMSFLKAVCANQSRDFTCPNPHMSFAPVRSSVLAAWFVDGASYMSAVADALEAATEEIYIADWWLSPEIHMKRPAIDGDYWRLDKILKRKAVIITFTQFLVLFLKICIIYFLIHIFIIKNKILTGTRCESIRAAV